MLHSKKEDRKAGGRVCAGGGGGGGGVGDRLESPDETNSIFVMFFFLQFWNFNGLAGLCISVYCVRLGVLWRFRRRVVMGVSIVWVAYMYIFLDQRFTNHVHVAS